MAKSGHFSLNKCVSIEPLNTFCTFQNIEYMKELNFLWYFVIKKYNKCFATMFWMLCRWHISPFRNPQTAFHSLLILLINRNASYILSNIIQYLMAISMLNVTSTCFLHIYYTPACTSRGHSAKAPFCNWRESEDKEYFQSNLGSGF